METGWIQIEKVSLRFPGEARPLFENLSLTVNQGEAMAILGPSGSGKTVLLKMLAGLIPPHSGAVRLDGEDLYRVPPVRRRQMVRRLAMTFQRSGLFDSLSCGDNLRFPLQELTELGPGEIEDGGERSRSEVGLMGQEHLRVHEMSGGMQKRLGIARALVLSPELILYDEPTAGLDPLTARSINELILKMRRKYGTTLIVVTSDPNQAYALADRAGFLHEGHFLTVEPVESFRRSAHPAVRQFVTGALTGPLTPDGGSR